MSTATPVSPLADLGTTALPEGSRVDFERLRAERRRRLFDALDAHDLDVVVVGRPADVQYASGARQLWTAGTRPFGPMCVVVRETRRTHLLSVWDEGVPPEIDHADLYGLSWNPANVMASLRRIPGLADAERVGTASLSPGFGHLVEALAPGAVVVDAGPAIWSARTQKTADELRCIATATAVAESALAAMISALGSGVTERQLLATYVEHIASRGLPIAPSEGVACATSGSTPSRRRLASDRTVAAGELVALDPGASFAGYEGGVGRTWLAGPAQPTLEQQELSARCRTVLDAVVAACREGSSGAALRQAWAATGEALPEQPFVHGIGLGVEPPVIGRDIGSEASLQAGSVLSVSAWVGTEGVGGFFEREVVVVGSAEQPPEVLSRYGRGPLPAGG